ncbi:hypothetical protein MBLNU457_6122t1 [Dothideomycetes sp. NU457]
MFCDESEDIARKAGRVITRRQLEIRTRPLTSGDVEYQFIDCTDEIVGSVPTREHMAAGSPPGRPPTFAKDDLAMGLFFTHYIVKPNDFASRLPSNEVATQAMYSSMKAVGLGGLAAFNRDGQLRKEAMKQYTSAVALTNVAIQSVETAKLDSTLLTVLLLSTFESMASNSARPLDYWINHINGAASLLSLRSYSDLADPHTARLCIQVAAYVQVSCLLQGVALPPIILDQQRFFAQYVRTEDPVWRYQTYIVQLVNFRAAVKQGTIHEPTHVLAECNRLDALFASLYPDRFQPGHSYDIVEVNDSNESVYSGKHHIYENEMAHLNWNGIRSMRILINEMILEYLPKDSATTPQNQAAQIKQLLQELQDGILSSVPQSLGRTGPTKQGLKDSQADKMNDNQLRMTFPWLNFDNNNFNLTMPRESSPLPWVRLWGGYTIMWPLYTAGSMLGASEASTKYAITALRLYEKQTGAQQAAYFANALERKVQIG